MAMTVAGGTERSAKEKRDRENTKKTSDWVDE